MSELTERQERERRLHDRWASEVAPDELLVEESFAAPTALENRFILGFLGSLAGKRILDLGAGAGEASLFFASRGARVTALDISPAQIAVLSRAASARGLAVEALAIPAEELPFPDQTFDLAYGNSVLHHVDYRRVVPEVRRVLKPGGRVAFIEPLAYNPLIQVYRRLGADIHTPDERPLTMRDIRWIMSQLGRSAHREFWISALVLFLYFWLGERASPMRERYWKKVIRDGHRYGRFMRPFFLADRVLGRVPGVRLLAWNTVITGER